MKVLVVDDSSMVLEVMVGLVTRLGHDVTGAADGMTALEAFAADAYDVVLTDLDLPDMTGFDVLAAVRREREDIPVVALTGHDSAADRARCLHAGMSEHLAKPVNARTLASVLEMVTGRAMDWTGAIAAMGGDEELLAKIVDAFRDEAPGLLDAARTALHARDAEALRRAAHTLHGSMRYLDAPEALAHARALEEAALDGDWDAARPILPRLDAAIARILPCVERFLRER